MTMATAAVLRGVNEAFSLEQIELDAPASGEVLVRIVATGLCHTDLAVQQGHLPTKFPVVVGHEGAGVVEAIGTDVANFAPGDRVVASFMSCGTCPNCADGRPANCLQFFRLNLGGKRADGTSTARTADGGMLRAAFFGQSSFATHAIASTRNLVKVPDGVPLEIAGPLGCGVQTGAGTVLNSLGVPPGSSLVVGGAGTVGLSAVMASKVAGVATVIAIDVNAERMKLARELGATHTIDGANEDVVARVREITAGAGAAYGIDTTGVPGVIARIVGATQLGAKIALVGVGKPDATLPLALVSGAGKTLVGAIEGDSVPQDFIPLLLDLYKSGAFPFDRLITTYPFHEIDQAIADTTSGSTIKAVLMMPSRRYGND